MESGAAASWMARYFGLTLLGLGVVTWFLRSNSDLRVTRGLLLGLALQAVAGVFVSMWGIVSGTMNGVGWSAVVIYAVLLAGYLYYLFFGLMRDGSRLYRALQSGDQRST
jgi:chromate transport protein ChrA